MSALALELGMDPGTCHALGAMCKQLRWAFKIAGPLGLWWHATNSILQGCPLSVIVVNVLTTIWKGEVDSLCRQVCARTAALPLVLDEDAAEDLEPGAPLPSRMHAPATLRWGCRAMRMPPRRWPWTRPASKRRSPRQRSGCRSRAKTSAWKNCSRVPGEHGAPVAATFRWLTVDVAIGGSKITGPVLSRRVAAGRSALRRLTRLSTNGRRERAISTLVTPLVLHGVAVTLVTEPDLRGPETAGAGPVGSQAPVQGRGDYLHCPL